MILKICKICNNEKPLSDFYKHFRMADRHLNICKDCKIKYQKEKYKIDIMSIDYILKERERGRKKYHKYLYKNNNIEAKRKWDMNHKKEKRTHDQVHKALLAGKIIKMPCEICGSVESVGHHEDYDKPLSVNWYCVKCHSNRHVEIREIELRESKCQRN